MTPVAIWRDSRAPWKQQGCQSRPKGRCRREDDGARYRIIRSSIPRRQDTLPGFPVQPSVDGSHHGEESPAALAEREIAWSAVHHLGHLSGNTTGRTAEGLWIVFVDRVRINCPTSMRATFPESKDLEEVVHNAHHQIAHRGDPGDSNISSSNASLLAKAQVEQVGCVRCWHTHLWSLGKAERTG